MCVLFGAILLTHAQKYQKVVYLKNGDIVKGAFFEQSPNGSLKIKTTEGFILTFQKDEIEKVSREKTDNPSASTDTKKLRRSRGYQGFLDFGGFFPIGKDGDGGYSIYTTHGYQINPYIFVGAGIGGDYHFGWEIISIPIYGDFRANFLNKAITPFFDVKLGHSVLKRQSLYFSPGLGLSIRRNNRVALTFSIDYNLQIANITRSGFDDRENHYYYDYEANIGSISFKLGVEF